MVHLWYKLNTVEQNHISIIKWWSMSLEKDTEVYRLQESPLLRNVVSR
jgi:hypothetical protein